MRQNNGVGERRQCEPMQMSIEWHQQQQTIVHLDQNEKTAAASAAAVVANTSLNQLTIHFDNGILKST